MDSNTTYARVHLIAFNSLGPWQLLPLQQHLFLLHHATARRVQLTFHNTFIIHCCSLAVLTAHTCMGQRTLLEQGMAQPYTPLILVCSKITRWEVAELKGKEDEQGQVVKSHCPLHVFTMTICNAHSPNVCAFQQEFLNWRESTGSRASYGWVSFSCLESVQHAGAYTKSGCEAKLLKTNSDVLTQGGAEN